MRLFCNSGSKLLFILTITMVVTNSCAKDRVHPVPFVPVDFEINIESTQHIELNAINGWAYYTGGLSGIIIYRLSVDEFRAFDRACPVHPFDQRAVVRVTDPPLATCGSCTSTFLLIDGSPVSGSVNYPLKEYRTFFDYPRLRVSN